MADKLVLDREQTTSATAQPQTLPIEEAIQQIRRDSRRDPETYLDETVVPHGGE